MKRLNVSGFSFHRLGDNYHSRNEVEKVDGDLVKSSVDPIINMIYAPDSRTGLPTGDLVYWVSDNVNPEVKDFIKANLMMDVSVASNIAADANLSDEDILALSPNKGESIEDYAQRLNQSIDRDKWLINQAHVSTKPEDSSVPSK